LLFVYDGNLIAQPFDSERLELSGTRMVLASDILTPLGRGDFSVSSTGMLAYRNGPPKDRQLAWFDRQGNRLENVGPHQGFVFFSLSPDEERVAMAEPRPHGGAMWVMELDRPTPILHARDDQACMVYPVWSPDGSELLLSKCESGQRGEPEMSLVRQTLNTRSSTTVLSGPGPKFLTDWSLDGRYAAYYTPWPEWNGLRVFIADLPERQTPRRFAPGPHGLDGLSGAAFSPEPAGAPRWVAYTSDETGRSEVYVGNFPTGDRKWPVSNGGGREPHWRRDGRELFYLSLDGILMSVDVTPGPVFKAGSPRPLFRTRIPPWPGPPLPPGSDYGAGRDGRRFLINEAVDEAGPSPITIVTAWHLLLRK